MKSSNSGFSLIELMIVVAIVGILAAIAIPAYQNYTVRAQVSEGLTLAGGLKVGMTETFTANGEWPAVTADTGADIAASGKYVESVTAADGVILVRYGRQASDSIAGDILALAPGVNASGAVVWTCGRASLEGAGTDVVWQGDAATITTVAAKYLPAPCRG